MIKFTVYENKAGEIVGFDCSGHARYAEEGHDIICAAVSVLIINTFKADQDEKKGIWLRVENPGEKSTLLLNSLVLGMEGIIKDNDGEYIKIIFKEV